MNNQEYAKKRSKFWDRVWLKYSNKKGLGGYYHKRLARIYQHVITPDSSVLEIGCGNGKLLGNLNCTYITGIDFSAEAIALAKENLPNCKFVNTDIIDYNPGETYDYIILSDLLGDLWDVQLVLQHLQSLCHQDTKIILNYYSKLWELPLRVLHTIGLKKPTKEQNWLTRSDVRGLLNLSDFEAVKSWQEILLPIRIPLLNWFINSFLVKIFFFRHFALANFMVARTTLKEKYKRKPSLVSVIVAARNEEGHIEEIIKTVPTLGEGTELIFVEGGSTDDTFAKIESEILRHPEKDIKLFRQTGKGKGDAVRLGFSMATGNILMILDADLTVPPDKLHLFYNALVSGKGEFINGVRLVYPMEKQAMRFFNLLGNKFFSGAFSFLLGQNVRDTLCGTKVLWKSDYEKIAKNRNYFGDFDPFGDFDLLFGASKLSLKIHDLPIRYQERQYGDTNISRWKHGFILLRMTLFASRKLKFI